MTDVSYRNMKGDCDFCHETVLYWWVGPTLDGWDHVLQCPNCRVLETVAVSEETRALVGQHLPGIRGYDA